MLPDLGQRLAGDSKALPSAGKPITKKEDGRRETDAAFGKKEYKGTRANGTLRTKTIKWFGFKLHLIVDAQYELPLAYGAVMAGAKEQMRSLVRKIPHKRVA